MDGWNSESSLFILNNEFKQEIKCISHIDCETISGNYKLVCLFLGCWLSTNLISTWTNLLVCMHIKHCKYFWCPEYKFLFLLYFCLYNDFCDTPKIWNVRYEQIQTTKKTCKTSNT